MRTPATDDAPFAVSTVVPTASRVSCPSSITSSTFIFFAWLPFIPFAVPFKLCRSSWGERGGSGARVVLVCLLDRALPLLEGGARDVLSPVRLED